MSQRLYWNGFSQVKFIIWILWHLLFKKPCHSGYIQMTLLVWVFCIGIDSPQRGSLYVLWTINICIMCAMIDYTFIMCSLFIYHTVFTQETHENSFRSGYIYMHFIIVFVSVYLQMTGQMTQVCFIWNALSHHQHWYGFSSVWI